MSDVARFWLVIGVLTVGTLLQRSLPFWTHGRTPIPPWLDRLLKHVPAAALTAIVVPGVLYTSHAGVYAFSPARTIAGLAALVVALKSRNMLATLVVGMGVLWVAQALLGS